MKDNICQTQFSAKEQLNNFPSNSAPAESEGHPLIYFFILDFVIGNQGHIGNF